MTPRQIDAVEAFWQQCYAAMLNRVLDAWKRDMAAAGKTPAEIEADYEVERETIEADTRRRMAAIRPLIVSAHLGLSIEDLTNA